MKTSTIHFLIYFLLSTAVTSSQWFQQASGTTINLHSINFHHGNENLVWSCGDNGIILHTSNGGVNWVQQVSGTANDLYCICFMETVGGPVMAVGENGTILRTTNNGVNWVNISSPTTNILRDISDYNFVAVGDNGTILKSSNTGQNWVMLPSPVSTQLNATSAIFANYIVGNNGTVLKGFNLGTNWVTTSSGTTADLLAVPLFGNTDITVGTGGIIWRSSDFGASWFGSSSNTTVTLRSVEYSVNNTSRIYICGDNGTIIKSTTSGSVFGFQTSGTSQNLNSIFFYLNDNTGYCCGNNGVILKTTNGGGAIITALESNHNIIPAEFQLNQNYPNPFNPGTVINFSLPYDALTMLTVYDVNGKTVDILVNRKMQEGNYSFRYDAGNLPAGIYFCRLNAEDYSETIKMILVK